MFANQGAIARNGVEEDAIAVGLFTIKNIIITGKRKRPIILSVESTVKALFLKNY